MFQSVYPLFSHGRLLKIEMLESLRNYPRDLTEILWKGYQNGILMGCDITVEQKHLFIQPGILHYQGALYVLKQPYEMAYQRNNRLTVLKVNCMGMEQEKDFIRGLSRIYFDFQTESKENEIELCRFQLREGADLRSQHTGYVDQSTCYDTINRIHAPYLGKTGRILAPEILLSYARDVLLVPRLEPEDLIFCFLILEKNGAVEPETLQAYLRKKGVLLFQQEDNLGYYEGLLQILKRLEDKREAPPAAKAMDRGILFD